MVDGDDDDDAAENTKRFLEVERCRDEGESAALTVNAAGQTVIGHAATYTVCIYIYIVHIHTFICTVFF